MGFLVFLVWIALAFLVGAFAARKGRSGGGYGLLALLISPLLAFVIVLALGTNRAGIETRAVESGSMRKCPFCAELVKAEATVCRYCRSTLPPVVPTAPAKAPAPTADEVMP